MQASTLNSLALVTALTLSLHYFVVQCQSYGAVTDTTTEQDQTKVVGSDSGSKEHIISSRIVTKHVANVTERHRGRKLRNLKTGSNKKKNKLERSMELKEDPCIKWFPNLNVSSDVRTRSLVIDYCTTLENESVPTTYTCIINEFLINCTTIKKPECKHTFENLTAGNFTIELKPRCTMCMYKVLFKRECVTYTFKKYVTLDFGDDTKYTSLASPQFINESRSKQDTSQHDISMWEILAMICGVIFGIGTIVSVVYIIKRRCKVSGSSSNTSIGQSISPSQSDDSQTRLKLFHSPGDNTSVTVYEEISGEEETSFIISEDRPQIEPLLSQTLRQIASPCPSKRSRKPLSTNSYSGQSSTKLDLHQSPKGVKSKELLINMDSRQSMTNLDSRQSMTDLDSRQSMTNLDSRQSMINLDPRQSMTNLDSRQSMINLANFDSEHSLTNFRNLDSEQSLVTLTTADSDQSSRVLEISLAKLDNSKLRQQIRVKINAKTLKSQKSSNTVSRDDQTVNHEPDHKDKLWSYFENFEGILEAPMHLELPKDRIGIPYHLLQHQNTRDKEL